MVAVRQDQASCHQDSPQSHQQLGCQAVFKVALSVGQVDSAPALLMAEVVVLA